MDVGQPVRSVVPSLDGPVYAALHASTAPQTLTEVHAIAGRSLAGVRGVLQRMVGAGIVLQVPGGYVLNRDHVAAGAIEALAGLWAAVFDRIRAAAEAWDGDAELVGLFGSAARRDGDESSDIDILVVSDDARLDELVGTLARTVRRWTGNRAQVVGRSRKDLARLRRAREPIVDEWDRDLVVICGDRSVLGSPT